MTSKEDKSLHGYGVGNIRKTVEKYGGMMRLTCKDKIFTMELILQK
ncbi:MAG: GHKL domain-containing protein [Ruminococcus sp.]|nr:GHKL domain-containing protein [Ruminococcus sp.]